MKYWYNELLKLKGNIQHNTSWLLSHQPMIRMDHQPGACFQSILHGTTKQLRLSRKGWRGRCHTGKGGRKEAPSWRPSAHEGHSRYEAAVTDVGCDGDRDDGGWRRVFVCLRGFHRGGERNS